MRRAGYYSVLILLCGLFSCNKQEEETVLQPAMLITVNDTEAYSATFTVKSINATGCSVLCLKSEVDAPDAEKVMDEGTKCTDGTLKIEGLDSGTDYIAYGIAYDDKGNTGNVQETPFTTVRGTVTLYSWEKNRTTTPTYSNLALCYGGSSHRVPYEWNKDRFDSHVVWTDADGKEHWLFDAFLAIEFTDNGNWMEYACGYGRNAADKDSWIRLLDYWFCEDTGFGALDKSVGDAISRLGEPATKRKVVLTMPDPILHQNFKDLTTPTNYWGKVNGVQMDFNKSEDRLKALEWYIDEARARWDKAGYNNLEFIGFYCVSEDLAVPGYGWSQDNKRWEDIYPAINKYIHSCNETMTWIPYNSAAGYQLWKDFEMDFAMMQPNYFWHEEYNMDTYMGFVTGNDLSMEFEIDDAILDTSSGYTAYRKRTEKYWDMCHQMDLYGKRELSYYMGSNTLYKLAHSNVPTNRAYYNWFCGNIVGSIH